MKWKNTFILLLVTLISALIYIAFLRSEYYPAVESWINSNKLLFIIYLLIFKVASIIWPPLTGGAATLASIPFVGWKIAYLTDLVGSLSGGVIAYYLGKKYGRRILLKLFDEKIVEKLTQIKLKKGKELEAFFVYRVLFGATIMEVVYYGAGFLKMNFRSFLMASVITHAVMGVPVYYVTKSVLEGRNVVYVLGSLAIAIPLFMILKKRYFEL